MKTYAFAHQSCNRAEEHKSTQQRKQNLCRKEIDSISLALLKRFIRIFKYKLRHERAFIRLSHNE